MDREFDDLTVITASSRRGSGGSGIAWRAYLMPTWRHYRLMKLKRGSGTRANHLPEDDREMDH
jgi:hypothetical protein